MAFSVSGSAQQSEINVTPLIDVLLVLLIIFMVIVPVTPRGLESKVPQNTPSAERSLPPLVVRLRGATGPEAEQRNMQTAVYTIDGRRVERAQMAAELQAGLGLRANRSVWMEATPELSYRLVAEVVSEAKAADATAIGLGRIQ